MSNHPSIAVFGAEAEALGLGGEDALDFVYKQQEFYRNERAAERAARAADAERVASAAEAERVEKEAKHVEREKEVERVARAAEAERAAQTEEREAEIEREVRAADAIERERDKAREQELRVLELTKKDSNADQSLNITNDRRFLSNQCLL